MSETGAGRGGKPQLLILCFSDIYRDTRVLKQIHLFEDQYDVTTCGFGKKPDARVKHIELKRGISRPLELLRAALIRLHAYRLAYWVTPHVRQAYDALRKSKFAAVLANDLDTSGLAVAVEPGSRVHMDIHEYWPGLQDQDPAWVKIRQPYNEWMLAHYVTKAASLTVVNDLTGERYEEEFGLRWEVVPNASAYRNLEPTEVGQPLRAVYAGGPNPMRRIDDLMRAAALVDGVTLDLYLLGEGTEHYGRLQKLAEELGDTIRILPPTRSEELVEKLNEYDIGFHSLPPTNTNHLTTMPNKFYEYIQARLALVLGPSPTMIREAAKFDGAVIAKDFTVEGLAEALASVSPEDVARMKQSSHAYAPNIGAEQYNPVWDLAIAKIVGRK